MVIAETRRVCQQAGTTGGDDRLGAVDRRSRPVVGFQPRIGPETEPAIWYAAWRHARPTTDRAHRGGRRRGLPGSVGFCYVPGRRKRPLRTDPRCRPGVAFARADRPRVPTGRSAGCVAPGQPDRTLAARRRRARPGAAGRGPDVPLVGAPVSGDRSGVEHIGTLRVDGAGVAAAYLKVSLGDAEAERFAPGPGPVAIDVDGWRVGLATCRDTGVAAHVAATAALGLDLYAAGVVHHLDERAELSRRARAIAAASGAPRRAGQLRGPHRRGVRRHRRPLVGPRPPRRAAHRGRVADRLGGGDPARHRGRGTRRPARLAARCGPACR